jgi:tetratricopeptide (TPR) repeat protein
VLAGISAAVLAHRQQRPYLLVGWLWYLGMLVPAIGLKQVAGQAMADRYTYLPQIGISIALVWWAADLCRAWPHRRPVCSVTSAMALTVLIGCAWRQTSFWCDSETLWTRSLACTSYNKVAHNNLAADLAARGQFDEAVKHYRQSLEINPNDAGAVSNLGVLLVRLGRWDEAMACYRKAQEIEPGYAIAYYNLGGLLADRGRFDEAIAQFQRAIDINPDFGKAHCGLGIALAARGRPVEALEHYRRTLKLQPDNLEAQKNLAWLRATCPEASLRDGAEAIQLAQQANRLCDGQWPDVLDVLAAAYAEAGRFSEALAAAHKALELAIQQNDQDLAEALRARIALYEAGQPYRQTNLPLHGPKTK